MKKIIVSRKDEYMSGGQTFSFYVNQKKYLIDTNSSITIDTDAEIVEIYAQLNWMKTRVITLNPTEHEFNIRIKPFLDDKSIKIGMLLFIISVVLMISNYDELDLIARVLLITMMAVYVYTFTIGYRSYLKLEINNVT
jgi:hypothetical protein